MADSGFFQFNDIELNIAPEQIITDRKSINNYWKTLRTRSSIKTQSSMATLDVLLQNVRFTDTVGDDGRTGYEKLTDVVSQIRVVPFVWVDNTFLRNSILGGDTKQAMVFAVRSIEIRKTSTDGNTNVIEADIFMHWFNYFPFAKNYTFKSDIWKPIEVQNPRDSAAWRLLYTAEQNRKISNQKVYTPIKELGVIPNNLTFTQFAQISVKNYTRLAREADALKKLKEELSLRKGTSEFPELSASINETLTRELDGDAAAAKVLQEEVFGSTTSMNTGGQDPKRDPLQAALEILDKNLSDNANSKYGIVLNRDEWKVVLLRSGKTISIKSTVDARHNTVDDKPSFSPDDALLIERERVFSLDKSGLIVTGMSITFANELATMPMLGHPYPTFQHVGGYDARIDISMVTTREDTVRSLSNFYSVYEQQAFKNRNIPAGQRNIRVQNDIINACGVKEVINERLTIDTVVGSPGTFNISLQLVDNPITSATQEKISPGQSFTSSANIRQLVADVIENNIKIDTSVFTLESDAALLNRVFDFGPDKDKVRVDVDTSFDIGFRQASTGVFSGENPLSSDGGTTKLVAGFKDPSLYLYTGSTLPEDITFRQLCQEYAKALGTTYLKLLRGLQDAFNEPTRIGADPVAGFAVLTDRDILSIEKLQLDLLPQLKKNTRIGSAFSYDINKEEQLLAIAAEGDPRAFGAGIRRATALQALNQLSQVNTKLVSSEELNNLKQEALTSLSNVRGNREANSTKQLNDVSIVIEQFLTRWQTFAIGFLDKIIDSRLSLPQFSEVTKALSQATIASTGDAYPDFPLSEVIDILSRTNQAAIKSLNEAAKQQGIFTKNIGISALIGPDFYLFNPQIDTLNDLIEGDKIRAAVDAITISQGDKRLQAEASWFEGIYKDEIVGPDSYTRTKGFSTRFIENDKQYFERDDPSIVALKQEYNRLASSATDPFAPDDLDGDLPSCIGNTATIKLPAIVSGDSLTDKWNSVVNTADAVSLIAQPYNAEAQHRLGLHSITNLPSGRYRAPAPTDPDKIPDFVWPVGSTANTRISSYFGDIRGGISKTPHTGIDIVRKVDARVNGSSAGAPIFAAADGVITSVSDRLKARTGALGDSGQILTFGELQAKNRNVPYDEFLKRTQLKADDPQFINYSTKLARQPATNTISITMKHSNGFTSTYKHLQWDEGLEQLANIFHHRVQLSDVAREQALTMSGGQEIARLGNTGYSTGAHLHFNIKFAGTDVDPCDYLDHSDCIRIGKGPDFRKKLQGPTVGIDAQNESLLTKSIDQLLKDANNGQGFGMARAFPTFKLYFIESDLGERQHFAFDDFFSYSSVNDITVIKNRKIAADLCILELTNVSGVLTNRRFQNDPNPNEPRDENGQEIKKESRLNTSTIKENPIASMMLQPGVQIQLRLGYNNNPEELENVFNGLITDVEFLDQGADLVRITCQSFGVELVQTQHGDAKSFGGWFSSAGKTSEILEELMAYPQLVHFGRWEGGEAKNTARSILKNDWKRVPNPTDDNIFAPTGGRGIFGIFDSTPKYQMYKTTIWEVFQEMTLRHPAYIAYPVPYEGKWGPRMTMFFGVPDQLYFARDPNFSEDNLQETLKEFVDGALSRFDPRAVELDRIMDGSVSLRDQVEDVQAALQSQGVELDEEQRKAWLKKILKNIALDKGFIKPFRNYHTLTSSMHILRNNVSSSAYNTFNVSTVQHSKSDPGFNEDLSEVTFGNVDTFSLKVDAGLPDQDQREMLAQYPNCVGHEMAKRYALSLLWRSMKEGYSGSIITIGNPRIKPYDICYIFDDYTDMFGAIEVEQVVHRFSHEQGFVSEITPDMVIHVNQASTMATTDAMGLVAEQYLGKIGMRPAGAFLQAASSVQSAGNTLMDAQTAGDFALGAAAGTLALLNAPVSAISTMFFNSSENALGIEGPTTTFGLLNVFGFSKWITRTQMAHPLRYAPLVMHGKPMLGGIPSKTVDGGFIQGIKSWFKDTAASAGLFIDDFGRENNPNNWIGHNSQGDLWQTILGRNSK